jgi:hypothetical protein
MQKHRIFCVKEQVLSDRWKKGQAMVEYVIILCYFILLLFVFFYENDPFFREYFSLYFDRIRFFVSLPIP